MDLTSKTSAEKYQFAFDLDSDHAGAQILRLIGNAKDVLEIGAGPGSISRPLIELTGCRMTALELDPSSIAILRTFCDEVVQGDLNDPDWVKALPRTDFDAVIIADVLEHLFDPWSTLRQVSEIVSEDGFVIVSIPHSAHAAIMACLLVDDFRYGEWGLLDKTHIRFFGMRNIQALFEGAGFKVVDARFVIKHPSETEFADIWQKLSDDQRVMLEAQPHAEVYQVVAKLAPAKHRPQLASRLLSELLVPEPAEVTYVAFYLPQFHPVPENDEWWGKGFTEWTNVTKAPQLFEGHYQPHLPADFGFYDLRLRDVQHAQIECAKKFGVDAFCFHYYWFGGRRILERPVEEFLADKQADIKFCLCWANENWTRNWDASEHEVLIEQQYSPEHDIAFIQSLLPFFRDQRHVRVDGAPVLVVYRPQQIPDALATTQRWRQVCRQEGIGEIHLVAALTHGNWEYESFGFDAGVEFPPHNVRVHNYRDELNAPQQLEGLIVRHSDVAENYLANDYRQRSVYRGVYPSWDNTARMPGRGLITMDATPECYERWLNHATSRTLIERKPSQRLVFINAWNEWAEGCHLEPDRRYGHAFLEATLRVKQRRSLLQSAFQIPESAVPVSDVADMPAEPSDASPDPTDALTDVVDTVACKGVELFYAGPPPRPVISWVARRLHRYPLVYRVARLVWGDIRMLYARTRRFATPSQR
jgi:2-polyprenyl-3-methyl-5-hydroxy-6-metoxy-1,4-benzoquinol methylase